MELLVPADDLTGAIEIGALLARAGTATPVTTELCLRPERMLREPVALVVDTESRYVAAEEAAERVGMLAGAARERGVRALYKKTDSTLRGNIAAELGAVAEAWQRALVYVPAYPAQGRVCRGGRLYVRGRPVERTEHADEIPGGGARSVPEMIARGTDVPVGHLADAGELRAALGGGAGARILICDAETDEDLACYAKALVGLAGPVLAAGPGGFAAALADTLDLAPAPVPPAPSARRVLIVCGSLSPTSLLQVRRAEEAGIGAVYAAPEQLVDEAQTERLLGEVAEELRTGGPVLLSTAAPGEGVDRCPERAARLDVRRGVARLVARLMDEGRPEGLAVFGGDTAYGIMEELGGPTIWPADEVLPGVPVSLLRLAARELVLVTKAGDFGPPDVVERMLSYLAALQD